MNKVGIMGGTFNPIHFGHLFLAEYAYEQIGLDRMLFMPSNNPPHKTEINVITGEHRLNMVKLAIEDNPHFEISDLELVRKGMTYTADTLTILSKENPDTEYYFIIGADSLMMMPTWKDPEIIFRLSTIVSSGRDHLSKEQLDEQVRRLQENYDARIILLNMPTIDISSADIRDRIASNKSLRYYVPKEVLAYIKENGLYGIR